MDRVYVKMILKLFFNCTFIYEKLILLLNLLFTIYHIYYLINGKIKFIRGNTL